MSARNEQASTGNGGDKPAKVVDGGQPATPQSNFERLIGHLAKDSLAAKLVTAYAEPGEANPADAVANVATARLDELKRSYDECEDQQD